MEFTVTMQYVLGDVTHLVNNNCIIDLDDGEIEEF